MIDDFKGLGAGADIKVLFDRARTEAGRRDWSSARRSLLAALSWTDADEALYARAADLLSEVLARQGEVRAALSAAWYASGRLRQELLLEKVPPLDRARTLAYFARSDGSPKALYMRAASELEGAGLVARAALLYEEAEEASRARALWSRLAGMLEGRDDPYPAGLARYNLARTSRISGDDRAAHEATVAAVQLLEEAADRFESSGLRERAFDCYRVLIAIGRITGVFEHGLEGYVNALRILREDNLRHHALRLHEEALARSERAGEYSAGATLARELTEYARRMSLPRVATKGILKQGELWQRAAEATLERGGPLEIAENALVASLLAHAEASQYKKVRALYARLSDLDLSERRKAHYRRASERYAEVENLSVEASDYRSAGARGIDLPAVWRDDIIEWEEDGSAAEACADVLLDPEEPNDGIARRSALLGRLAALAAGEAPPSQWESAHIVLAEQLAPIELYSLLAPLEKLAASPVSSVRRAAIKALSGYYYKRTFVTLERALGDPDRSVAAEATTALERLRFDHAFDPLARIYRTAAREEARLAALKAIARLDLDDAAELVLGVLEHGGPAERKTVLDALRRGRASSFQRLARQVLPTASPNLKQAIEETFQARRWRL